MGDLWENVAAAAIQEDIDCQQYTNDKGEDVECHTESDDLKRNEQMIMNSTNAANSAEYSIDKQPAEMNIHSYWAA